MLCQSIRQHLKIRHEKKINLVDHVSIRLLGHHILRVSHKSLWMDRSARAITTHFILFHIISLQYHKRALLLWKAQEDIVPRPSMTERRCCCCGYHHHVALVRSLLFSVVVVPKSMKVVPTCWIARLHLVAKV